MSSCSIAYQRLTSVDRRRRQTWGRCLNWPLCPKGRFAVSFSPVCGRCTVYSALFALHLQSSVKEKHTVSQYGKRLTKYVYVSGASVLKQINQPMCVLVRKTGRNSWILLYSGRMFCTGDLFVTGVTGSLKQLSAQSRCWGIISVKRLPSVCDNLGH